ncbi:hypothetical protein D0T12_26960 [Actinomadura spongiicola]|uniref:Clp R domain-containing protein n=2 Tax=Actinomadura spongiicola TaxID=2303421 RepID=A0A372GBJ8_9ACTN|nr:hypothetical protein D0T12_26960 [Actinomadura spongiicola]
MVKDSARKRTIRARMAETGKSYTDAARELDQEAARRRRQPVIIFEWFSGLAHEVVERAREHARSSGHDAVGTEHLLLGLTDDRAGDLAFQILDDLAGTAEAVRAAVVAATPPRPATSEKDVPWSENAAFVLGRGADRQRDKTGHGHVGPEHILLALLALGDCRACRILSGMGITSKAVRTEVVDRLNAMGVISRYHDQPTQRGPGA